MAKIIGPLTPDPLDGSFNYIHMIELFFGPTKADAVAAKHKLGVSTQSSRPKQVSTVQLEMQQRFRDNIEVKLSQLQAVVHQMSKGSYLLKESEFTKVFRSVGIIVTSQDYELLAQQFLALRNPQTHAVDFRVFLRKFQITDTTTQIIS